MKHDSGREQLRADYDKLVAGLKITMEIATRTPKYQQHIPARERYTLEDGLRCSKSQKCPKISVKGSGSFSNRAQCRYLEHEQRQIWSVASSAED